jgi:serine/threonine-protein kinase RsbW
MFRDSREAEEQHSMLRFDAPAKPESVGLARDTVRAWLATAPLLIDDAMIVVSELFTNAVRHAGLSEADTVQVMVAREPATVIIEVEDSGPGFDPARIALGGPSIEGGFGLRIVAALSEDWGSGREGSVWARLAWAYPLGLPCAPRASGPGPRPGP